MLKNTKTQYGSLAKFFHWSSSIIVLGLLAAGFYMTSAPEGIKETLYGLHQSTGLILLLLVTLRLTWTLTNPKPASAPGMSNLAHKAEWSAHALLYFLLFAMPLTGWAMSTAAGYIPNIYGLFELAMPGISKNEALATLANNTHEILGWTFAIMIGLHIAAALWHHIVRKDNTLKRMMPVD